MLWISMVGLVAGFVGSLILAFSLNRLLAALNLAATTHDATFETQYGSGPILLFTNIERQLKRGASSARWRTAVGAILLALSFACQLVVSAASSNAPMVRPDEVATAHGIHRH